MPLLAMPLFTKPTAIHGSLATALPNLRARFHIEARPISFEISVIYICDANTGEILATCEPETEGPTAVEDWEDNYNEDEGFDPYLGCYTDDC